MRAPIMVLRWALACLMVLATGGGVLAHAVILETDPADGALLEQAPQSVLILFNEPVSPVRAQVLDATGDDITLPDAVTLNGPELRMALPGGLPPGSYIASYRVVSADSHPIAGSIAFSIGQVSSSVAAPESAADDAGWQIAMTGARALVFAGILGGAGGVLFLALVLPAGVASEAPIRRTISAFAAGGCVAAVLAMGIQGGLLLNAPAVSLLDPATWRIGIGSYYGRTATAALIGLALVVMGLRAGRALRPLAWLGAAIALGGFALSGHVVTSGPKWLTVPTLIAHTTAAAFWAGALIPLRQILAHGDSAAPMVVERFSRLAVVAVGILFVAGIVIAALQVRSLDALLMTGYGISLTLKLILIAGLIVLAAWNKIRLTPALVRGRPTARGALQRTILAELALVGAILAATGFLGTQPPPRVLGEGAAHAAHFGTGGDTGLSLTIIGERRSAEIMLASALSGINRARLTLLDTDGTPLEAQEVTLIASNPGAGVEPIERAAEPADDDTWRVDNILLAPAGRWTLQLDVLISDFEKTMLETRTDLLSREPLPPASGS